MLPDKEFIPEGLADLITVFTAFVALLTLLQILKFNRLISATIMSAQRQNPPTYLPMATMVVAMTCTAIFIVIGVVQSIAKAVVTESSSTEEWRVILTIIGAALSYTAGGFLEGLAKDIARYETSGDKVHPFTHGAVFATATMITYLLAVGTWSQLLWFTIPGQAMKTGAVLIAGLLSYVLQSKAWEFLKNDEST